MSQPGGQVHCVRCISPILFKVGIPNFMCGCILGWGSVMYHFRVTVTLTSDLFSRIIMSRAYLLYYLRPRGGTLIFSHIRRLGPFFWVQNSEFQYFLGFSEN